MFVAHDNWHRGSWSAPTKAPVGRSCEPGRVREQVQDRLQRDVVEAVAVHDDAMLARVATVLALHSVGSFSYIPAGDRAVVRLEVLGGDAQTTRVLHKLRRLIGVVHAACVDPA
jgi:hypothetical protein